MNFGYIRVATAIPDLKVADCKYNSGRIIHMINQAVKNDVQIISFPELSITSYTCGDLFNQHVLIDSAEKQLSELLDITKNTRIIIIVGIPIIANNQLLNCAVILQSGKLLAAIPKTFIPNDNELYEKRWFTSSRDILSDSINICGQNIPLSANILIKDGPLCFAVEIGEDLSTPIPPSSFHCLHGANIIFNMSAHTQSVINDQYIKELVKNQSNRCISGYIYVSAGMAESTTDAVFSGNILVAENGNLISHYKQTNQDEQLVISDIDMELLNLQRQKSTVFKDSMSNNINLNKDYRTVTCDIKPIKIKNLYRKINPHPFIPNNIETSDVFEEIFSIQVKGLVKRYSYVNSKYAVIGISGGLDSTLALLVAVKAFDMLNIPRKNILGITMPGFGTTERTLNNSYKLMNSLDITAKEINIEDACLQHFKDIDHDINVHDITFENVQARERTQILMDIANKEGGLVIGTGDLSELALGWTTYNADHMSMYAVNIGVAKTIVRRIVSWVSDNLTDLNSKEVLLDILDTPISPELLPLNENKQLQQKTEDVVGPYELHDFFIYNMLEFRFSPKKILFLAEFAFEDVYNSETIRKHLKFFYKRFFTQQFKRSCLPDGPQVDTISLSPRTNWRMASDASYRIWIDEIDSIC